MLCPSADAVVDGADVLVRVRGVAGAGDVVIGAEADALPDGGTERAAPEFPAAAVQPTRGSIAAASVAAASAARPIPEILMLM